MKRRYLSFTQNGNRLAKKLAEAIGGEAERCNEQHTLSEWTETYFHTADCLIYVGAAGIAVRAIAPFLQSKDTDPAVVVVDEGGNFAIPILSGHLGGANALARKISRACGALPVITTATDVNGIFAVDEWAKEQGCAVENIHKIKEVSGRLLEGKEIYIKSDWQIAGECPENVCLTEGENYDVRLSISRGEETALRIIPKIAVLGIGCRKGISAQKIEETCDAFLWEAGVHEKAIALAASIDLKKEEEGLLQFCKAHAFPFRTFSAEELRQMQGDFSSSAFVQGITGVDNICERSAVFGGGMLYQKKFIGDGVTMALALRPFQPDWRQEDE